MIYFLFYQISSHSKSFFTFFRKYCVMPLLLCFRIKHCPLPVSFTIVPKLQSISTYKHFCRTHKAAQSLLIIADKTLISCVRSIACHDKQNRYRVLITTRCFQVIYLSLYLTFSMIFMSLSSSIPSVTITA